MKNIKNLIYLLVVSLMVVSCGQDEVESITNFGQFTSLDQVKVSFKDTNNNMSIFEGDTIQYRIGMPQAVDGKVEVMLEVTSTDGGVEATFPNPVVLDRGQSEVLFDFIPTDDMTQESESYDITIKEIKVTLIDGSTDFFTFSGDNKRTLKVKDIPTPIVTTVGDLDFNLTWSGNVDLDCRIRNSSSSTIDTGYSVSPGESVTLPSSAPDGDYTFSIRPWSPITSTDYNIELVAPTESRTYSGTLANLGGFWSAEPLILQVNKVTAGSVVTYTITEL